MHLLHYLSNGNERLLHADESKKKKKNTHTTERRRKRAGAARPWFFLRSHNLYAIIAFFFLFVFIFRQIFLCLTDFLYFIFVSTRKRSPFDLLVKNCGVWMKSKQQRVGYCSAFLEDKEEPKIFPHTHQTHPKFSLSHKFSLDHPSSSPSPLPSRSKKI